MKSKLLVGANEIAKYLGISRNTLFKYYQTKKFPLIKIRGRLFARKSAIDVWMQKFEGKWKKQKRDQELKK